ARVLVALVAVEAVVDLLLDLARIAAAVGEREAVALPALVVGTDEELLELLFGTAKLDEVLVVERLREVQRRPDVRRIRVVLLPVREPGLDGVERERHDLAVLGVGRRARARDGAGLLAHLARVPIRGERRAQLDGTQAQLVGPGRAAV